MYCSHKWRRAYFFCTFRCTQMSAEPSCTVSFCSFIIKIFVCAFSLQTNWASIRTDTSHWPMKWIPPSQNWLVINHIHYMKQQVNWTRILIRVTSQYGSFVDFSYSRNSAPKSHVYLLQRIYLIFFIGINFIKYFEIRNDEEVWISNIWKINL